MIRERFSSCWLFDNGWANHSVHTPYSKTSLNNSMPAISNRNSMGFFVQRRREMHLTRLALAFNIFVEIKFIRLIAPPFKHPTCNKQSGNTEDINLTAAEINRFDLSQ